MANKKLLVSHINTNNYMHIEVLMSEYKNIPLNVGSTLLSIKLSLNLTLYRDSASQSPSQENPKSDQLHDLETDLIITFF
jgi:hypothetical protein